MLEEIEVFTESETALTLFFSKDMGGLSRFIQEIYDMGLFQSVFL